ncbi:glycosyltransferase family 2 protein [Devosia sp. SL43]|uniref:glycosyltransferase family 2 protein n=1 Tax=Devosia sp. SL43 TaxID=2806348 RepID=UPI001F46A3DD|nr:glycosyltransferase family 2 protein [Devosia sp. SL43]UJW86654.1 glycosyltransferase [Devosia sp. SL43]
MSEAATNFSSLDEQLDLPRNSPVGDALQLAVAELLVHQGNLSLVDLAAATRASTEWGHELSHVLIAQGYVRRMQYYKALAAIQGLPFVNLREQPSDPALIDPHDRVDYTAMNLTPWRIEDGKVLIAVTGLSEENSRWAEARFGAAHGFVITSPYDILWQTQAMFRERDSHTAREGLYEWKPEHSAKFTVTKSQKTTILVCLAVVVLALIAAPMPTLVVLMSAATALYTLTFAFKFLLTWVGSSRRADMVISDEAVASLVDRDLPVYTVLVPMYREARVLPLLAKALRGLDYPASKVEVKLVLEENDDETIDAAKALNLPGNFEIIRVPESQPKTKPKACNYALQFCRGEFLTIYDAEDQPEADQLKKAVLAFRTAEPSLACVQGRLNYFNRGENWLTAMFTLEYSQWFDFMLPGLDRLKVPIPLGGTSNHFKLSALRHVNGWDPYNVTEDADLGVRLAQEGYTVGVINSTTYEEANGVLPSWIKQRSRWIKGYMQTWLVHMRHPVQLYKSIGPVGFFAFHFFIGAPAFTVLLNPILWAITLLMFVTQTTPFGWLFPEPFGTMAVFNLVVGNLFLIYFGVVAALKRRYFDLVLVGLTLPFYWVLHSIAGYKALKQLISNPHYWEKTEHGTSAITQANLAAAKAESEKAA